VSAKVALPRIVRGGKERAGAFIIGIEQGPFGVFAILVWVAQHELTERDQVSVVELIPRSVATAVPVQLRLADAVDESKRLAPVQVGCTERITFEGAGPLRVADLLLPLSHFAVSGE